MKQVSNEIVKLCDMGKTIFIVTHDLEFILSCCDYIVRLENGKVTENYELSYNSISKLYRFFLKESTLL